MATLGDIEKSLRHAITFPGGQHTQVHIRFGAGYLDCRSELVLDAIAQINRVVSLCECGVVDPLEHRAESLLLMILDEAYYHGYTPLKAII